MTKISFKYMTSVQIKEHLPDITVQEDNRYPVHTYERDEEQGTVSVVLALNNDGKVVTLNITQDAYDALPTDEVDYVCCQ